MPSQKQNGAPSMTHVVDHAIALAGLPPAHMQGVADLMEQIWERHREWVSSSDDEAAQGINRKLDLGFRKCYGILARGWLCRDRARRLREFHIEGKH